ncbi:MAG: hypothetical protein HY830_14600 [Actinobacteria bacterium]|jgi:hypothetical protein|nr:hypothetical protein [Actinomycetota bacterium]
MTDDATRGPDPAAMLAVAEEQQARALRLLEPDGAVIYGAWGVAWLVGPGLMWLSRAHDVLPIGVAGAVFAALLLGAGAVTAVHVGRRTQGVQGVSQQTGALHGWSWFLGFATLTAIMAATARAGASDDLLALLWTALSCLVVGVLYMAAGALWRDLVQYSIGVWILVIGAAGALAGVPTNQLLMSLAGGGVFLGAAALSRLRRRA